VRARTKDLGCHRDGKYSSSPEVLPWPAAADLASEQKGHDRGGGVAAAGSSWETKRGKEGGGTPFIPRETGVACFTI
jgi:hypothetical protein